MTIFRPEFGGLNKRVTQLARNETVKAFGTGKLNGKPCVVVVTDQSAIVSDGTRTISASLIETFATPTAGLGLLVLAMKGR